MVRVPRGALVVVVLALAACSDDDTADPGVTTTESPTTTVETTTTADPPPDPSVIPDDPADIDEEYVEAVLTELFHLDGEVIRIAQRDGASPELSDRTTAIFVGHVAEAQLQALADAVATDFEGYSDPAGDVGVDVSAVVAASSDCVSVEAVQDFRQVGPAGLEGVDARIELRPNHAMSEFNPTAWVIELMQPTAQDEPPPPCAG